MSSEDIFSKGLAIGSYDLLNNCYIFRYRNETYTLKKMILSLERPNRLLKTFSIPELRYGLVAKINDVRKAMEFE